MATTNAKVEDKTRIMVGPARFSYMNAFTPRAVNDGDKEAYSVTLLIPKTEVALIKKIKEGIEIATEAGIKKLWKGVKPGPSVFKYPLHDGDVEKPDQEAYAGMMFVNARNTKKPGVLMRVDNNNVPGTEEAVYSGSYGYATVQFFPFDKKGKGVGCSLQNILKTKDGERLAGGASAEEDFAGFEEAGDDML